MADEENPFGGGPFGVGPFGPLVAAAVAAVTINAGVSVTTSVPRARTLYYQAKIAPPPQPPVVLAAAESFSVTTGRASSKSLFYQARIAPPLRPAEVVVADLSWHAPFSVPPPRKLVLQRQLNQAFVPPITPQITTAGWMPTWRGPLVNKGLYYQSSVDVSAVETEVSNLTATLEWMPAWRGPPSYTPIKVQTPPFIPKADIVDRVTPDKWLQAWRGPPRAVPASAGGSPFIPKEAVLENTVTPDKWLGRFQGAVPVPPVHHTQPVFGYPYPAAVTLTTTLEWMPTWRGPPQQLARLPGGQPFVQAAALQVTTAAWLQPFQRAVAPPTPIYTQPLLGYQPVVENTITGLGWQRAFPGPLVNKALYYQTSVSVAAVEVAADNNVTGMGWQRSFPGPLVNKALYYQTSVSVAAVEEEEAVDNTVTGTGYIGPQNRAPQKTWPALGARDSRQFEVPVRQLGVEWLQPFGRAVAKAPRPTQPSFVYQPVVVDNLTTTLEWLARFSKAVPTPKPVPTQPVFGYPYEAAVAAVATAESFTITTAYPVRKTLFYQARIWNYALLVEPTPTPGPLGWLQAWKGPPRYLPLGRHPQPFFGYPYSQTDTCFGAFELSFQGDAFQVCRQELKGWFMPLSEPVKARLVRQPPASPFALKPPAPNLTTTLEWLFRWQKAVPIQRPSLSQPVFGYPYPGVDNTQTPDKWLQRWRGPPRYWPPRIAAQPFVPREAVLENTQTPNKWLFRFQKPVPHGWPIHTQPFFGHPYRDLYSIGGPADESERIVCVPESSRLAVEPDVLRTATVPLQGRVAIVPELLRVAEVPEQSRTVNSNDYRDRPCHDT